MTERLESLERDIIKAMNNYKGSIYEPVKYIMSLGGKRIRPILLLEIATALHAQADVTQAAIGMEIFHNFSLVHDDIMDMASLRRGKETVHIKWNENQAILSGDIMYGMAYEFITKVDDRHLRSMIDIFTKCTTEVCVGQQMDLDFETQNDVSFEEYLEMIKLKTSVLIGACAQMGAVLADTSIEESDLMYSYGLNMGMAFQIQDDYLDLYGTERVGKRIGGDILNNKKTILHILAVQKADETMLKELDHYFSSKDFDEEKKIAAVKNIYDLAGAKDDVLSLQLEYYEKAKTAIESSSLSQANRLKFLSFAKSQLKRDS